MIKRIFASLILLVFMIPAQAQEFVVPSNVEMEEAEDYARYEEHIIDCIDWLSSNGPETEPVKRKRAMAFLMMWLTGTPAVSMELHADMMEYADKNPGLLMIFMGGWAKYALESDDDDQVAGNVAGLEAVIAYYEEFGDDLKRDRSLKKLAKLKEKGELEDFVKEAIEKS